MKTEKKRGRGRPKKVVDSRKDTMTVYDISTNEVVTLQKKQSPEPIQKTVLQKDFSITIDNQTPDGSVQFKFEGDKHLSRLFLTDFYLSNQEFRSWVNNLVVEATREKANRLSVELNSIVG